MPQKPRRRSRRIVPFAEMNLKTDSPGKNKERKRRSDLENVSIRKKNKDQKTKTAIQSALHGDRMGKKVAGKKNVSPRSPGKDIGKEVIKGGHAPERSAR